LLQQPETAEAKATTGLLTTAGLDVDVCRERYKKHTTTVTDKQHLRNL
jgi:hypothetical protein